jgi:hypothetical protein
LGAAQVSAETKLNSATWEFCTSPLQFDMALSGDQCGPVRVEGKFFRLGDRKWYVKGFAHGPFPPNGDGEFLPDRRLLNEDFAGMQRLGANAVRLYQPPQRSETRNSYTAK